MTDPSGRSDFSLNRIFYFYDFPGSWLPQGEILVPRPASRDRADLFTGTYRDVEYLQHTLMKIISLLGHVSVNKSDRVSTLPFLLEFVRS